MMPSYRIGLIGHNISYSKSGEIYAAIFRHLGVQGEFCVFDVPSSEIESVTSRIRNDDFTGVAVTIPHKKALLGYLDSKSEAARLIGATNSINVQHSKLLGHNTDCDGFTFTLGELMGAFHVKRALVFGNGGSARAVIYSLVRDFGCHEFVVLGRSKNSLAAFRSEFLSHFEGVTSRLLILSEDIPSDVDFEVAVNSTPLGGWHFPEKSPFADDFNWFRVDSYIDLNYNENNRTIRVAEMAGVTALNGAAMLVAQAIKSFALWTGQVVAFRPIFASVFPNERLPGGIKT